MDPSHHLHHQQLYAHQISSTDTNNTLGGGGDRFPQWSIQETRDFLMIRSELDPAFMETKRNKLLWEVISNKMKELGYNRSPDQCKCKWKNLVTRYKGCETLEVESMRQQQFPFYNELQALFGARIQRMVWMEAEGGSKKRSTTSTQMSSDEEDENEESEGDHKIGASSSNKKKRKVKNSNVAGGSNNSGGNIINSLKEMLEDFMKQQMQTEMQWMKMYETREEERRVKEMEWRKTMEALENERIMSERMWREREEEWRRGEEVRAEKRDALITALLNKLRRENNV